MRSARTAVAAVLLVLLLAGCTSIPTSGGVQLGPTEKPDDPGLVFVPNPPADGADVRAIVSGFVYAATEGGSYTVAREFLTPDAAKEWDPDARVLVHDEPWELTVPGDDRVELSMRTSARVDDHGVYGPSDRDVQVGFQLTRVRGQWRISEAPPGVILAANVFPRVFGPPRAVQFFDPTWTRLVPDQRWFTGQTGEDDAVVRALLAGPSGPIGTGVTRTAFEVGTELESVSSTGGMATVALTVPGTPDDRTVERMQQQLSSTLGKPTSQLRLIVNGRTTAAAPQLAGSQLDPAPIVVADGRFGALTSQGEVREDAALGKRITALAPTAVTASTRQGIAAVLTGAGDVALVTTDATTPIDTRRPLAAPTVDQLGWVYSVPAADPGGMRATSSKGDSVALDSRLDLSTVTSIQASPDGTRLLVLGLDDDSNPSAFVVGIERSENGTPVGTTADDWPVQLSSARALSATWTDESSVAVLTSDADGQNQTVAMQLLGGVGATVRRVASAIQIVGGESQADLRALLQNGDVYTLNYSGTSGSDWEQVPADQKVSVLAVQR
jgi:hypothetical protein